jgi:2',3'-cyclic-nucleotide 2'-phosphodiesterase/3'-nucleotidase
MVETVRAQVTAARAEGCDLVVLLAHTGIDLCAPANRAENAIMALAAIDGADVVMGGHVHSVFPFPGLAGVAGIDTRQGTIHGTSVVMAGFWGNHLGQVDLVLEPAPTGGWRVAQGRSHLVPVSRRDSHGRISHTTPEDPQLVAVTAPAHAATLDFINQPVGSTLQPLHSFFSPIANDTALQLVAAAQTGFIRDALANTPLSDIPVLAAVAPFKTGRRSGPDHFTHIPPGPLTHRDVADLYSYPNTICAVKLDGQQLLDWLEHSASLFSRLDGATGPHESDPMLLDDAFPGYKFDVITGIQYQIDLRAPARCDGKDNVIDPSASRIRNLRWKGRAVQPDQEFIVATNSYRAYGIGFAGNTPPEVVHDTPHSVRDIVLAHIRDAGPLDLRPDPVWSFVPLGGRSVLYLTSPEARAYLDDPHLPPVKDLGDTDQGFACLRLRL